jgi:hypothetical protein
MINHNLGNSADNIIVTENVLSQEEHKKLLDYAQNIESWEVQPWGVRVFPPNKMPEDISVIL